MRALFFVVALLAFTVGCSSQQSQPTAESKTLKEISPEQWERLASRTFYFGHQSVGQDVITGLRAVLAENPQIKLQVLDGITPGQAGLQHFAVGVNEDPHSKNVAFAASMKAAEAQGAVMMYKFCYIDVTENTDIERFFELYRETVESVRAARPDATLVHVTMPLRVSEPGWRYLANSVRGIRTQRGINAKRTRFNELLHATFGSKDAIFDLAEVESTRANGERVAFKVEGKLAYALAPEWSYDGKHLNAEGAKRAAERLLVTLASLPPQSTAGQ